ncbi:hypothetical protein GCM10022198_14810 [Klugiella xanthotipulae]|uniref:Pectate lyase-like protein n=1 Tax=Klugiella xanthotipulae TaxID=244735 RepID=A0A543I6N2_9MICO|nr:glycosyl hydrolase family 28-related protein [Klugiella xanthotipulae]TQM66227.1 pectate lyase-like protein [Klugiella xanthotipulae]
MENFYSRYTFTPEITSLGSGYALTNPGVSTLFTTVEPMTGTTIARVQFTANTTEPGIGFSIEELARNTQYTLIAYARLTTAITGRSITARGRVGSIWDRADTPLPLTTSWQRITLTKTTPTAFRNYAADGSQQSPFWNITGPYTGLFFDAVRTGDEIEVKLLSVIAGGTAPTATITQIPSAYTRNVVTDYGAVGDGVHDDSDALEKALNLGGALATVVFPPGTYRIKRQLTWDPYSAQLHGTGASIWCDLNTATPEATTPATKAAGTATNRDSYAIRVVSSAPFRNGSTAHNRLVHSGGIRFFARNRSCNGLLLEGKIGESQSVNGTFERGRRKDAHLTFNNLVFEGFNIAHCISSYTFMTGFRDCTFRDNNTAAYLPAAEMGAVSYTESGVPITKASAPTRHVDRGERIFYDNCDFVNNNRFSWLIHLAAGETFQFMNCSFDWFGMLLRAENGAKINIANSHIESPGDGQMLRGSRHPNSTDNSEVITYVNQSNTGDPTDADDSAFINKCFASVHSNASVNISQTVMTVNYVDEPPHIPNPVPFLFYISPLGSVSLDQCSLHTPAVEAFSTGGGRISITNPRFATESYDIPLLGRNPQHDLMPQGTHRITNSTTSFPALSGWTAINASVTGVESKNSREIKITQTAAGDFSAALVIPVTGVGRITGFSFDVEGDDILGRPHIDFNDARGNTIGRLFEENKKAYLTTTATTSSWGVTVSTTRTHYRLVRHNDHQGVDWSYQLGWNPQAVRNIRIVLPCRNTVTTEGGTTKTDYSGSAGTSFTISNMRVNTYG